MTNSYILRLYLDLPMIVYEYFTLVFEIVGVGQHPAFVITP